jgi:hypothetical protein
LDDWMIVWLDGWLVEQLDCLDGSKCWMARWLDSWMAG